MMKRFKITKVARTLAIAATATAGILTSCTDYSEFTEAELKHQEDLKSYTEMFKAMFGEFDPNHTWGMNEPIRRMMSVGSPMMGTRAGENPETAAHGFVNVNLNEWVNSNISPAGPYRDDALAHDIQIPGWPHLNDLYYGNTGGSALGFAKKAGELINGDRPCGDITEFEIQYVSTWFRTHKNPQSIELHLSDFFIQNVCADADQVEYRDTQPNTNIAGIKPKENGANIQFADDAKDMVDPHITKQEGHENSNERINYSLDQLCFKAIGGSDNPNMNSNGWTHVNNFNNGNVNWNPEASTNNAYREIKYITSSGTEDFACRSSMYSAGGEKPWLYGKEKNWVLVHLQWVETVKDPKSPKYEQAIPREGYYLAFDFETETPQTKVERDGYYSNWIIKITPGHFTPESGAHRVFCEDLGSGSGSDFDFNDAVFDVAFDANGQTVVTVQATGATMPIYIGFNPDEGDPSYVNQYEIHNLLGHPGDMTQINVKDDVFPTHAPAIFRGRTYSDVKDQILSNLSMYVKNTRNGSTYKLNSNEYDRMGFGDDDPNEGDHHQYKDWTAAPCAFAVPSTNVRWMVEYKPIDKGYPYFPNWCAEPTATSPTGAWYTTLGDKIDGVLYDHNINKDGLIHGIGGGAPADWIQMTLTNDVQIDNVSRLLKLKAYDGENAIWRTIEGLAADHQITFTVVLTKSPSDNPFQCIMIPADYNSTTTDITYQGYTKDAATFPSILTRWKDPTLQDGVVEEQGKDTYAVTFNFTKQQLCTEFTDAEHYKLADYILLYIKDATTGTVNPSTVNVKRWFVHY